MISIGRRSLLAKCSSWEFEVKTWPLYQYREGRFISLSSEFTTWNVAEIRRVPSGFGTCFNPVWLGGELYLEGIDGESPKTAEKNRGRKWCLQSKGRRCWQDGGALGGPGQAVDLSGEEGEGVWEASGRGIGWGNGSWESCFIWTLIQ